MQSSNNFDSSGQNFSDYRYQKALKQISKLIAVNRQIKVQAEKVKIENDQITQKFSQILNQNKFLQNQVESTRHNLDNLKVTYQNLQTFCEKLQRQNTQSKSMQQKSDSIFRQRQQKIRQEFQQNKLKWLSQKASLFQRLEQHQKTIEHYHQKLQNLIQLQKQVNTLSAQLRSISEEKQNQRRKSIALGEQLLIVRKKINQKPPEDLVAKIKISEDWIKSLNVECYQLKQKLLQIDCQKQKTNYLANINSASFNQVRSLKLPDRVNSKLQAEIKKIKDKYERVKIKMVKLQTQNQELTQQTMLLNKKVKGYQKLTQKQQLQIEQLIFSMHSNHQSTDSLFMNEQIKSMIDNLKIRNEQLKNQTDQKCQHLKYYEELVKSLKNEQEQFIGVIKGLQAQIQSPTVVNADLSKTYKATSVNQLTKTQPLVKTSSQNGPKVFIINGKKYEKYQQKLNNIQSVSSIEPQPFAQSPSSRVSSKNNMFQSGDIQFTSSQRQYGAGSINIKKIK